MTAVRVSVGEVTWFELGQVASQKGNKELPVTDRAHAAEDLLVVGMFSLFVCLLLMLHSHQQPCGRNVRQMAQTWNSPKQRKSWEG